MSASQLQAGQAPEASTSKVSLEEQLYLSEQRANQLAEALHSVTSFFHSAAQAPEQLATSLPAALDSLPPPVQALIISLKAAVLRAEARTVQRPSERHVAQLESENARLADLVDTSTTAHLQQQLSASQSQLSATEQLVADYKSALGLLEEDADLLHQRVQDLKARNERLQTELRRASDSSSSSKRRRSRSRSTERTTSHRDFDSRDGLNGHASRRRSRSPATSRRRASPEPRRLLESAPERSPPTAPKSMSNSTSPPRPSRKPSSSGAAAAAARSNNRFGQAAAALAQAQASSLPERGSSSRRRGDERSPPRAERGRGDGEAFSIRGRGAFSDRDSRRSRRD